MYINYVKQHTIDPYTVTDDHFDIRSCFGTMTIDQLVYADDHTTVNSSIEDAQHTLRVISSWLEWTKCMKAKPRKCRSLGLSLSELKFRTPSPSDKTYSAFDHALHIINTLIQYIGDDPFKFLGRHIYADLSEQKQKDAFIESYESYFDTIDSLFLKGIAKAWLYNNYVIYYIA